MLLPESFIESPDEPVAAEGNTGAGPWPWPQAPQDFERLIDHFQDELVRYVIISRAGAPRFQALTSRFSKPIWS